MTPNQYFDKEEWDEFYGKTKYFNQVPWNVALSRNLLVRTELIFARLKSEYEFNQITFEQYCKHVKATIENTFNDCFFD